MLGRGGVLVTAAALVIAGCATPRPAASTPPPVQATPSFIAAAPPSPVATAAPPASPAASPEPTASASAGSLWSSVSWSAPATLPGGCLFFDIAGGAGRDVAAGQGQDAAGHPEAAAWTTPDLRAWTRTLLEAAPGGDAAAFRVVAVGGRLLAVGYSGVQRCAGTGAGQACDPLPVALWTSADGAAWRREATPASFDGAVSTAVEVAGDEAVVVGYVGWNQIGVWRSADGVSWRREELPPPMGDAHPLGAAALPSGGLVVTGRAGGHEPACCVDGPDDWIPAAWLWDGSTWHTAGVDGAAAYVGDEVGTPFAGAGGLTAPGTLGVGYGWTSADGRSWSPLPRPGANPVHAVASDGTRILGAAYADGGRLSLLVSLDGRTWQPLAQTGATDAAPSWDSTSGSTADAYFMVPDGLVAVGSDSQGNAQVWFATPG